jgi:hypothetical protein
MKFFIPPAALDQHIAILGKTGSGKTFCAKAIIEHVLRQQRQTCIIDPTGAWWGLRLAADGRAKGLDVVLLGGEHADVPLSDRSGAAVARLVTEQGASVVIDTSGFTVGEYTRWFIDFAGTLYTTLKNPLHLVIDEAHYFAPQGRVHDVDAGKMLFACNRLMSGGRSRGIRGMLITQRPAKLHKDSLTCADTLIAMRVIAPQDRGAIKDWIDGMGDPISGKTVLDSLAQLQRGEGWVWYPEGNYLHREKFPGIWTYDSSAAPKHGVKSPKTVGAIDLAEVNRAMAEAVKEAEANDPKLLRKRIAELEKKLTERPAEEVIKEVRVEVPVLANGQLERTEAVAAKMFETFEEMTLEVRGLVKSIAAAVPVQAQPAFRPSVPAAGKHQSATPVRTSIVPRAKAAECTSGGLTGPQQAILDTILMLSVRGITADRDSVARWLGIHPNGGSYGTNLGYLRSNGYLSGCVLTDLGQSTARVQETGFDAALRALEDEPKRNIIRALVAAARPLTRDELAEALGLHPNGGSYGTNLGRLRTMGLITERGPIAPTEGLHR